MFKFSVLLLILSSCGVASKFRQNNNNDDVIPTEYPTDCSRETIEDSLRCIPGISFKEVKVPEQDLKDYRLFEIQFNQFADHNNQHGEGFQQRVMLWHHDLNAPMVLQTTGYNLYSIKRSELAKIYNANQIQIEHRFFAASRPFNTDWTKLTVEQSAKDFHRVSMAFHSIYKKKWVGTGASKGGMTSVYHRYFYPNDLDATVAYVAPSSHSTNDERYNTFLDSVGGDKYAACRAKMSDFQRAVLKRKSDVLPLIKGNYKKIGSKELVLEYAVSESYFTFWQYKNPESKTDGCDAIPAADASTEKLVATLESINSPSDNYGDEGLDEFGPYFFQAAHELGAGAPRLANIADLVTFPAKDFGLERVIPEGSSPKYDSSLILKIENWSKDQAPTMMFVYGGFDSWYAAAFPKPNEVHDSYTFVQAGGNHGAKLFTLSNDDANKAIDKLDGWLNAKGARPTPPTASLKKTAAMKDWENEKTTEDDQFKRRH